MKRAALSRALGHLLGIACATGVAACSLLVRTDDLGSGDPADASATPPDDGPSPARDALSEGEVDAGPDADAALDPALLAYWSFDELAGTKVADRTGHGHDAILSGEASLGGAGVSGTTGLALLPGGRAQALSLEAIFPRTGTLSFWLAFDFDPTTSMRGVFDDYDATRSHVFFRSLTSSPPGTFQAALQPASAGYAFVAELVLTRKVWAHVVILWNEGAREGLVYQNGARVARAGYLASFLPGQQSMTLGGQFQGSIDEVRLYDRALSAAEVLALP